MSTITLRRGILIAIEGIDGAGKTTQAHRLRERLEAAGLRVVMTKEPTDRSEHGRRIRASAIGGRLSLTDELHAFIEDRREHVATLIEPELAAGAVVIVDRYYFSTAAYQGARGADVPRILRRNEDFAPPPDLLVHLEVDASVGVARIRARGDQENTFEQEADLRRCAEIFKGMDFPYLQRLDGRLPVEKITDTILERLYVGPLHERICSDRHEPPCNVAYCAVRSSCVYPGLYKSLGLVEEGVGDAMNAIVGDASLTDAQRIEALLKLARSKE